MTASGGVLSKAVLKIFSIFTGEKKLVISFGEKVFLVVIVASDMLLY